MIVASNRGDKVNATMMEAEAGNREHYELFKIEYKIRDNKRRIYFLSSFTERACF